VPLRLGHVGRRCLEAGLVGAGEIVAGAEIGVAADLAILCWIAKDLR
jgi:hypothetical protein